MSYILDALKKLEQEKSRKARTPGSITIAGELFAEERPRQSSFPVRTSALVILIAVAGTLGATWYLLKGGRKSAPVAAVVAVAPPVARVMPPAPIPAPVAAPAAVVTTPAPAAVPAPAGVPRLRQPPVALAAKPAAAPAVPRRQATDQDEGDQPRPVPRKAVAPLSKLAKQQPAAVKRQLTPAPADVVVSGVAWQDERGMRRAVVNGLLMKEGTTIAGAQIKEILPDRVRFERAGALFEVPFVSSAAPAAGK